MKVRLSAEARSYLLKEAAYLRQHDRYAAEAFAARMSEARKSLARFPEMGVGSQHLPIPGSRRLIVGDYLLDYDIGREDVTITSIRHGLQRPPGPIVEDDFDYEGEP